MTRTNHLWPFQFISLGRVSCFPVLFSTEDDEIHVLIYRLIAILNVTLAHDVAAADAYVDNHLKPLVRHAHPSPVVVVLPGNYSMFVGFMCVREPIQLILVGILVREPAPLYPQKSLRFGRNELCVDNQPPKKYSLRAAFAAPAPQKR